MADLRWDSWSHVELAVTFMICEVTGPELEVFNSPLGTIARLVSEGAGSRSGEPGGEGSIIGVALALLGVAKRGEP